MDEMSFVVTTLERINARLDKHDDKLDLIVQIMQQLVKVDTETKELRDSLGRNNKRLEAVEHNQNTDGCQAHKSFLALKKEQDERNAEHKKECQEKHENLDKRIETLEQKPMKLVDKFVLALVAVVGAGLGSLIMAKFGVSK